MSSNQIWNIKGKSYNHGQLLELRRKQLDPRTAVAEFKAPQVKEVAKEEKHALVVTEKILADNPELKDQVKVGDEMLVEDNVPLEEVHTSTLKKMAKEQGMTVTNKTKRVEVLEFLKK